jgi:sugar O-acyltransferase (sialic acid O-acetyltransferase NeuD family)
MTRARHPEQDVLILGAGGTGRDVLEWFEELAAQGLDYCPKGFLDDDERKWGTKVKSLPVLGPLGSALEYPTARFVDALGSPSTFGRRPDLLSSFPENRFLTLIHPRAHLSPTVQIGSGSLVYPHVTLTSGVRIGNHVTILANVVVNHDTVIGDYSIVASAASLSGSVRIGTCCYIGAGGHLIQGALVGDGSLVGMGSVVIRNVPARTVVAGNPARVLREAAVDR